MIVLYDSTELLKRGASPLRSPLYARNGKAEKSCVPFTLKPIFVKSILLNRVAEASEAMLRKDGVHGLVVGMRKEGFQGENSTRVGRRHLLISLPER